jgi:FlaG/FlaF family flagellin (archaellin)
MNWAMVIAIAWVLAAMPTALLLGRGIRLADHSSRQRRTQVVVGSPRPRSSTSRSRTQ